MNKSDNYGRTVTLKAKMPDFKILTRSRTFASEVRSLKALTEVIYELLDDNRQDIPQVRLLGVSVSNLMKEQGTEGIQLEFDFDPRAQDATQEEE